MTRALRTTLTLSALALLVVIAVVWGFSQMTAPFPGKAEAPVCVDTTYQSGDQLSPQDVTVSVINASSREGLASRTQQLFNDEGFASGVTGNAPQGTKVAGAAEVWVSDKTNPAVPLVRSRVGKIPVRVKRHLTQPGIVLVVGDQFGELITGLPTVTLKAPGVVCTPPVN